jgi:hypothetical protein
MRRGLRIYPLYFTFLLFLYFAEPRLLPGAGLTRYYLAAFFLSRPA